MHPTLAIYDASYEAAREEFLRVMEASPKDPANHLCQWLVSPEVSSWSALPSPEALWMSTLEGCVALFRQIRHAIHDDGEIAFVQTRRRGPKIVFDDRHDPAFELRFAATQTRENDVAARLVGRLGEDKAEQFHDSFEIISHLDDAFAFTDAYAAHQKQCEELARKIAEHRHK